MCSNLTTDMEVGYKVFRSNILKEIKLQEDRFGFEPEVTAKIAKKNIKIFEVELVILVVNIAREKITWKDGFSAIRCIVKYNFFK